MNKDHRNLDYHSDRAAKEKAQGREGELRISQSIAKKLLIATVVLLLLDIPFGILQDERMLKIVEQSLISSGGVRAIPLSFGPIYHFIHKASYLVVATEFVLAVFVLVFARVRALTQATRREAWCAFLYLAGLLMFVVVTKSFVGRLRPYDLIMLAIQEGNRAELVKWYWHSAVAGATSFPSGHTSMALSLAFLGFYPRIGYQRGLLIGIGAALLVGITRVLSAYHYPSDIVAAIAIGLLLWLVAQKYAQQSAKSPHIVRKL